MNIIEPSFSIEQCPTYKEALNVAERAARTCYKSEDKIDDGYDVCDACHGVGMGIYREPTGERRGICPVCTGDGKILTREPSSVKLIRSCIKRGHESVIEHVSNISVRFVCDRGVSHELVRHRLASHSQESTRYCDYGAEKRGIVVINPCFWNNAEDVRKRLIWTQAMSAAARAYQDLIFLGATPQEARSVLPNSLKTEIVVTANLREWRTIFKQRTPSTAHPQMRQLMIPLAKELKQRLPVFFEDLDV